MKSRLNEKQRGEICGILAMGGTRAAAARYVGCSLRTISRAAQADAQFAHELRQAAARAEVLQLKHISEAAVKKHD